jgi:hypothetical protein
LRGINFFRRGKGRGEIGRGGEGERGRLGEGERGERGRGGKIFTLDFLA